MAQMTALAAEVREGTGTGAARQIRRAGRIPCIIYGNKEDSVLISINPLDLQKQLRGPGFFARVFEIEVGGKKHRVLARDLQVDPVTDRPIHVDFMRFSATTRLNINVLGAATGCADGIYGFSIIRKSGSTNHLICTRYRARHGSTRST